MTTITDTLQYIAKHGPLNYYELLTGLKGKLTEPTIARHTQKLLHAEKIQHVTIDEIVCLKVLNPQKKGG